MASKVNPVTGMEYSEDWTIFLLEETESSDVISGKNENGIYTIRVGTGNKNWQMIVGDFISYINAEKLESVMCISEKRLIQAEQVYDGHCYNEKCIREYEPDFLIHSTTFENGERIFADGFLKSWNWLKRENQILEKAPIGRCLGDPDYFSDYIMFSTGEMSSEIVVMSKQIGEIVMDMKHEYNTGIRFYFDAKKMAEDGILVRDGLHVKVADKMPIKPYLLWWADWKRAGLKSGISSPEEFTNRANEMFEKRLLEIRDYIN